MELRNDTVINVAQLMKDDIGSSRKVHIELDWFALDHDLMAKDVVAEVRLTRISDAVLATGEVRGLAIVECARCLELFDQPFDAEFDQEYRPTINVVSGLEIEPSDADDDEYGVIDASHELDLAEPLRQTAILDLPIKPICRPDCPGLADEIDNGEDEASGPLGALGALLEEIEEPGGDR